MTADATLFIRNLDPHVRDRIAGAARARNMTYAQYITALADLHDYARAIADSGQDDTLTATLKGLGLETVTH